MNPLGGGPNTSGSGNNTGGTSNGTVAVIPSGPCATPEIRITEVDVGIATDISEDEVALKPLMLSPKPSGGSRLAFMGTDRKVHVVELDGSDQLTGSPVTIAAQDFGDVYADDNGGVLLVTRDAQGGGTLNCGSPTNLCGTPPSPAVPCYDMYMVRFDGTTETWATKLTNSSSSLPPYSTGPSGPSVYMIWWYAHHGRIASDGTNFAGFFGSAISVSQEGCINIHQGDRMKVVSPTGTIVDGGFDWGCSHSGYERIVWDPAAKKYVTICKNDAPTDGLSGKIAYAPKNSKILAVDLFYSNLGNIALAGDGGYWTITSLTQPAQTAGADGLADVALLHFTSGVADPPITLASNTTLNERAPHLANYGSNRLVAAWETSASKGELSGSWGAGVTDRAMMVQVLDSTTGAAVSAPMAASVKGNRYQEFRSFPDGSVAYPAPGSSNTKVKILRIMACSD